MIHDVSGNEFSVEVLDVIPSTNTTIHSFVGASSNCITHKKDHFYDTNIPIYELGKTTHSPTNVAYNPTAGTMTITMSNSFVAPQVYTPTSATFDQNTGILRTTLSGHNIKNGDMILIDDGALTMRCDEDSQATDHNYPRPTDPVSGKWLKAFNVGSTTFDLQVGNLYGNAAISNTTTHVVNSIASNSFHRAKDFVMIDKDAITLQCTKDNNATNHTYPRVTDPTYAQWLPISNAVSYTHLRAHEPDS